MYLFAFGLAIIAIPIWFILIAMKFVGIYSFCDWKYLLIPVWIAAILLIFFIVISVGFMGLIFTIEMVSK